MHDWIWRRVWRVVALNVTGMGFFITMTTLYLRNHHSHIYMRADGAYYVCVTATCEMEGFARLKMDEFVRHRKMVGPAHGPFEGQVEARHHAGHCQCRFIACTPRDAHVSSNKSWP